MPPGPDGDDEELVEIDVEIEGPPPVPRPAEPAETEPNRDGVPLPPPPAELLEITDAVELQPPIVEAAEDDPRAALTVYETEALAAEGGRRGALLGEVARLRESGVGSDLDGEDAAAALASARAAFETDTASVRALWVLRRLLARAGRWDELEAVLGQAATALSAAADPRARADLLLERGRLLEARLDRAAEAGTCYREALAASPDHPGALLALLLLGTRLGDAAARAEALGGLARCADSSVRRAALVIEESLARCRSDAPDGRARALAALEAELGREDPAAPLGALCGELDVLTRGTIPDETAVRALDLLAKQVAAADAGLAVALLRERAHLLRESLGAPEAALEALDEAARLDPAHPGVASERVALALALDRPEAADETAHAFLVAAGGDDEAVDFALAYVESIFAGGGAERAREILQTPRVRGRCAARADLRALELALAVARHDERALSDAFAVEAGGDVDSDAASKVSALTAAAAVRAGPLGETEVAADLYGRAIAEAGSDPGAARPAVQALAVVAAASGRVEEAAATLEAALARIAAPADPAAEAFELGTREALVAVYADELGMPGRALPHQRRLVALRPQEIARRVRLCDLDLESPEAERLSPEERAQNLLALAEDAGDPAVAVALQVAAARALIESGAPALAARGVELLGELSAVDPSGLAAAALERAATTPAARAEIVAAELTAAADGATVDRTRALRFRLAHHRAADGQLAEAMAALTPLRSEGDPLARAWSYELARRAGDAFLEVAVLSEETRAPDGTLGDEASVLLAHGEALADAGDPQGAAESLRRAVGRAPDGETAADAALGLYRLAASDAARGAAALPEALDALADALGDDPPLAAAAARESLLAGVAVGEAGPAPPRLAGDPAAHADLTLLQFVTGARAGDAGAVAASLLEVARGLAGPDGTVPAAAVPLLGRAAARARLAGPETTEAIAASVWQTAHPPELAPALADLPVAGAGVWPATRPDPRRARARRAGGGLGIALHLEAALDAERRGALGAALAAYGSVIALDPDRLEAWTGVRRVARAGGDRLGEARAAARLGVLVRDPARAVALFVEAGTAYERAGRIDDAIAVLARAVELDPEDPATYARAHALLSADLGAPGRAETFDGLLSYRLTGGTPTAGERIALLFERAEHRRTTLGDRAAAFRDFKQILRIDPEHLASLHKLAEGALADRDFRGAIVWLERYLAAAGADDEERSAAAKLDLADAYDARGEPARAIETLRRAAAARPGDPQPFERMADLQLARRDPRGAVEALRGAADRLVDPRAKAALALRAGAALRDVARDPAGAAAAFRQAADLDPLCSGAAALVALYEAAGDPRGALEVVEREIADLRGALAGNPLDARRLGRLAEWLADARGRGASGPLAEAMAVVENVRALAGGRPSPLPAPAAVAPRAGRAFLTEIADAAAGGFVAEVWPHLAEAAAAVLPAAGRPRAAPLGPEAAPRLAWIGAVAAAIGLPRLPVVVAREAGAPLAAPSDDAEPALVLGPEALASPHLRFHAGRALGLIAGGAVVLPRAQAEDLAPLFACAALLAGASVPAGLPKPSESLLREVTRVVGRKDRKALTLQASRFAFERFDLAAWRSAVLRATERFGLLVAGDPAQAAVALAGSARGVPANPAALELLGFALSARYPVLRRAIGGEVG